MAGSALSCLSRARGPFATLVAAGLLAFVPASGLWAQGQGGRRASSGPSETSANDASALVGAWSGTASIPLGDSTIVVPVTYTFTQNAGGLTGVAMVPGQGTGPIANIVKQGNRIRFRVTAPENRLLEHEGTLSADRVIEGMVNLDNKPIAKFRITPAKAAAPSR